ncbi:response regulator transcription factor [Patulibacter defluvii]|uniref:response regulator transcription factor n=1 Tax=Patulibacter defluvii TaxID=3095358 RepID=UPI002A74C5AD|nr:response regulator transcription factor [Patulibacter sp. DM4]
MLELVSTSAPVAVAPRSRRRARPVTVLVVDAHPVVHLGLSLLVGADERLRIAGAAQCGQDGIDAARRIRPDLVLLDPWLPDMLLSDAVRRLRAVAPGTRIVLFAEQVTPTLRDDARLLGVDGCLGKDASAERLSEVLARVVAGEVVNGHGLDEALRRAASKLRGPALTPREHEILRRAAKGESNAEIAEVVFLAPTTVKSYLQSALRKLGARNRVEAVSKLGELGLL